MIQVLKLISGEDLISEVLSKDNSSGFLQLKNAYKIVMTPEGLGLMPFMLFSKDKEFTISESNIMVRGEPEIEIRNAYSSQTGGVVLANNNMLITE